MSEMYPFRDDYVSTAEIGRRLGVTITARFIVEVLGVRPSFRCGTGPSCYWSPEQLAAVYEALIQHIRNEAGRSSPKMEPTNNE